MSCNGCEARWIQGATGPCETCRIATLEANLAASREREAALAAKLHLAETIIERAAVAISTNNLRVAGEAIGAYMLSDRNHMAILAAHDAEVERKAKVGALAEVASLWTGGVRFTAISTNPDGSGDDGVVSLAKIRARIAALKAEGGKG